MREAPVRDFPSFLDLHSYHHCIGKQTSSQLKTNFTPCTDTQIQQSEAVLKFSENYIPWLYFPQVCMHHFEVLSRIKQCRKLKLPIHGKELHAHVTKSGLNFHEPLFSNTLIDMYGKCNHLKHAVQLFNEMPNKDLASWASIFTAHNQANLLKHTLALFSGMFSRDGLQPDHFIFASLVNACASLTALRLGEQIHAQFVVSLFSDDDWGI